MKTALRLGLRRLRDDKAAAIIAVRIDRLCLGNPGDVKPIGGGVSEMRIDTVRAIRSIMQSRATRSFSW